MGNISQVNKLLTLDFEVGHELPPPYSFKLCGVTEVMNILTSFPNIDFVLSNGKTTTKWVFYVLL